MKEIQSQIKTYLIACGAAVLAPISLMAIPALEPIRESLAASIGLSAAALWIPIIALIGISLFGTYKILTATVAKPIHELARHVREGDSSGYNFKRRAKNREEVALKGYIESHDVKVSEIREERDELEKELKIARDERDIALSINNRQSTEIAELDRIQKKLRVESQKLAAANDVLESALETERKTKVGREVKLRTEEIYAQVGRAVSEASARAIWIPNLLNKIEAPTALINDLSTRLESSWNDLSLSRIGEEISKIREQSDLQCSLLESIDPDGLLPHDSDRLAPAPATNTPELSPNPTPPVQELLIGDDTALNQKADPTPAEEDEPIETPADEIAAPATTLSDSSTHSIPIQEDNPLVLVPNSIEPDAPSDEGSPDQIESPVVASDSEPSNDPEPKDDVSENSIVIDSTHQPDPESLSALQTLIFELVNDYSHEVEKISVEADLSDNLDVEVDEELLESVLSNLLEIAIYQWKEGSVKLRVSREDNQITFAVDSKGKPLSYGELDESQTNRIASALDRKIDVDMPSDSELRMRYRYIPEEV